MKRKFAILTPEKDSYSTTFIKAHMNLLKGEKLHLYGKFFPSNGTNVDFQIRDFRILRAALNRLRLSHLYHSLIRKRQLRLFLKKTGVQLVFAEFGPTGAEVAEICQKLQIPLVVHFHGFDAHAIPIVERYRDRYRYMFGVASSIIAVSEYMKTALLDLGCPKSKINVSPCGPSEDFFEVKPAFSSLNFLAVGRFVDKKAPHITIRSFAKVVEKHPHSVLTMAGDGPLWESSKQLADFLGVTDNIIFCGAKSHDEIKALYQESICFVQHSVVASNGDSEGTPVAILEAGASGLPVVATRHAGILDVIVEGETGFLVDEGDENSFAKKMIAIADDVFYAKNMGIKARERVRNFYDMHRHISCLQAAIDNA